MLFVFLDILDYSVGTMEDLQGNIDYWNYGPNFEVTYFCGPLREGPAIYPG